MSYEFEQYLKKKFSVEKIDTVKEYLVSRYTKKKKKLTIVFDLLHVCNLNCIGCGTDSNSEMETSTMTYNQVMNVLKKIKTYNKEENVEVFINFGGGEPLLRPDIIEIISLAAELFGYENIGIDTNATLYNSVELLSSIAPNVSYIGVSVNGTKTYHNWWAGTGNDVYQKTINAIKTLCRNKEIANKLEVTTIPTRDNASEVKVLMSILSQIGVKKYSLHRAMPVGRMGSIIKSMELDADTYFELFVETIFHAKKMGIEAHFHHSLEEIYASLICDLDTYCETNSFGLNTQNSIGINPQGLVTINPWCSSGIWSNLFLGNILNDGIELHNIFNNSSYIINQLRANVSFEQRCNGCKTCCSGGSRIVAASRAMDEYNKQLEMEDLITAMSAKDPGCIMLEEIK